MDTNDQYEPFHINRSSLKSGDSNQHLEKQNSKTSRIDIISEIFSVGNLAYTFIMAIIIFIKFYSNNKNISLKIVLVDYYRTNNDFNPANMNEYNQLSPQITKANQTYLIYDEDKIKFTSIKNCYFYNDLTYLSYIYSSLRMLTKSKDYGFNSISTHFIFNQYFQILIGMLLNTICKVLSLLIKKQFREDQKMTKFLFTVFNTIMLYFFYSSIAFGVDRLGDSTIDRCFGFKDDSLLYYIYSRNKDNKSQYINQGFFGNYLMFFIFAIYEYCLIICNLSLLAILAYMLVFYASLLKRNRNITLNQSSYRLPAFTIQLCFCCCFFCIFGFFYILYSFFGIYIFFQKIFKIFKSVWIGKILNCLSDVVDVLSIIISGILLLSGSCDYCIKGNSVSKKENKIQT